ncbi:hypothetical protein, partial [Spirosoma sp. 48-14]|uniref:hypothetical protein n=1 Tax=Spirosoma sp. 48-14 TaxID=1895854 RepID=UPI000B0F1308
NPISFTDPDGMYEDDYGGGDYYDDSDRGGDDRDDYGRFHIGFEWTGDSRWSGEESNGFGRFWDYFWNIAHGDFEISDIDIHSGWHDGSGSYNDFAQDMMQENGSNDMMNDDAVQDSYPDQTRPVGQKQSWDFNKDGKLQKDEADSYWLAGSGKDLWIDNSKIDWSGLEIPKGKKAGDRFSISTTDAFDKLPFETAATFGGTSFLVVDDNTVKVIDQPYHYNMRDWDSVENIKRNTATLLGHPGLLNNGKNFWIKYNNRTIKIKK